MDATQLIDDSILESDEDNEEERENRVKPIAKLRVLKNKHLPETEFPLYLGENVLGRDDNTCTLQLLASSVSKQHIAISISALHKRSGQDKVDMEALVWDLGSMNGTRKGHFKLTPHVRYALSEGDSLVVADIPCQYVRCDLDETAGQEVSRPSVNGESETAEGSHAANRLMVTSPHPEDTIKTPSRSMGLSSEQTPTQPEGTLVPVSDSDSDGEQGGIINGWSKLVFESSSHISSPTCSTFLSPTNKVIPESEDESPITPFTENRAEKRADVSAGLRRPLMMADDRDEAMGRMREQERAASKQADGDSDTDAEAGNEPTATPSAHPATFNAPAASGQVQFHMDSDTDVEEDGDGSDRSPTSEQHTSTAGDGPGGRHLDGARPSSADWGSDTDEELNAAPAGSAVGGLEILSDSDTDLEDEEFPPSPLIAAETRSPTSLGDAGRIADAPDADGATVAMAPPTGAVAPADLVASSDTDAEEEEAGAGQECQGQKPALATENTFGLPLASMPPQQKCSTPLAVPAVVEEMETQLFLSPFLDSFKAPAARTAALSCSDSPEEDDDDEDLAIAETQSFVLESRDHKHSVAEEATQAFCIEPSFSADEAAGRAASFALGLSSSSHLKTPIAMQSTQAFASTDPDLNQEATQCYAAAPPSEASSTEDDSDPEATQPYAGRAGGGTRCAAGRPGNVCWEETQAYIPESHSDSEERERRTDVAAAETLLMEPPASPTPSGGEEPSHDLSMAETQPMAPDDDGDNEEIVPAPRKRRAKRLRALEDEETQRFASPRLSVADTQPVDDGGSAQDSNMGDASRKRLPRRAKSGQPGPGTSGASSRSRRTGGAPVADEEQADTPTQPPNRRTRGKGNTRGRRGKVGPEVDTDEEEMEVGPVRRGRGSKSMQQLDKKARKTDNALEKKRKEDLEERERLRSEESDRIEKEGRDLLEKEKREKERIEQQRKDLEETERLERERAQREERERLEREEKERREKEQKRKEEEKRLELERFKREEKIRLEREEKERLEKERREKERLEKERQEKEEQKRLEIKRKMEEKQRLEREEKERLEKERQEKEEQKRKEEEKRLELEKFKREEKIRLEREEKERLEQERQEKEQLEKERQEKEEQKRKEEEKRLELERFKREEKIRLEREEKERLEKERQEKEELERKRKEEERQRLECEKAEREEKERLEREEKERLEKERQEKEEQKRLEKKRKMEEKQRLEREEKERLEKERQEKEEQKRKGEEKRLELEKFKREEKIRLEREEKEQLEKERQEKEEQKRLEIKRKLEEKQRLQREKAEREEKERLDGEEKKRREKEEQERLERKHKEEEERLAQEKERAERLERERLEIERQETEKQKRLERKRKEEEKKLEREKAKTKKKVEKEENEQRERREKELEREQQREQAEQEEKERLERLEKERVEEERMNKEKQQEAVERKEQANPLKSSSRGRRATRKSTAAPLPSEPDPASNTAAATAVDDDDDFPARRTRSRSNSSNSVSSERSGVSSMGAQEARGRGRGRGVKRTSQQALETPTRASNRRRTVADSTPSLTPPGTTSRSNPPNSDVAGCSPTAQSRGRGGRGRGGRGRKVPETALVCSPESTQGNQSSAPKVAASGRRGCRVEGPTDRDDTVENQPRSTRGQKKNNKEPLPDPDTSSQSSETPTPSRKRAAPVGRSPIGKTPRMSSGSPGAGGRLGDPREAYKVLFTGVMDEAGERIVTRLGGVLATSVTDMTYLVTDKVRRTVKFLCAVARGVPIVTPLWLEKCGKAGSFLSPTAFIVKDVEQEKKFNFSLQKSLKLASSQPLLQGFNIHVTKAVKPEPVHMKDLICCSGGIFLPKMPSSHKAQTVVVSCEEDWGLCRPALSASLPIVSAEFILTGILQYKIDLLSHALPAHNALPRGSGGKR